MGCEEAVLLVFAIGEGGADVDPFLRCSGGGDVGFFVAILVVEDAEGDGDHVKAVEVTVLAQGVVGGAEIGDAVAHEHVVEGDEEVGLDEAGREFGGGHDDVAVELAGLGADDGFGGVLVKGDVFGYDFDFGLVLVEFIDKVIPSIAAVAFFEPPGEVADTRPFCGGAGACIADGLGGRCAGCKEP